MAFSKSTLWTQDLAVRTRESRKRKRQRHAIQHPRPGFPCAQTKSFLPSEACSYLTSTWRDTGPIVEIGHSEAWPIAPCTALRQWM